MKVLIGKNSGFCAGVKYTITKTEENLKSSENGIDCLGELIHNKQVIEALEQKGLKIITDIKDAKDKVIIRAHGISSSVYNYAKENSIELIDLTCPKVLKIHEQVKEFSNNGYFIFLLGIKDHPETIGTFSFCGKNSCIIENKNDIDKALYSLKKSNLKDILIISQTTFSISLFEEITCIILDMTKEEFNTKVIKSICNATDLRQNEAQEISKKVPLMIIIGGRNSSNTKKLYEISKTNCDNVLHIQTKEDLDLDYLKNFDKVRNYGRCIYTR